MKTISEREALTLYRDFLNDIYGVVKIGGLEYETATAFELVDEIAFRCGFNDWADAEQVDII